MPNNASRVAIIKWPIDPARLRSASIEQWIHIHFSEMHAAILALAAQQHWDRSPFEAAERAVVESAYRFTGLHPQEFTTPDRRHKMHLRYDMDWRWFTVTAILLDRQRQEIGRRDLTRYPACVGPVPTFMRGKSHWKSNDMFVFVSSDTWFEPRQVGIQVGDFLSPVSR